MVCKKCEKKLSKLATPDPFNVTSSKEGKRRIGENLLLRSRGAGVGSSAGPSSGASKGKRFQPYAAKKCKDCGSNVSQNNALYCHGCAYKKGICSMCGKAILDTTPYTMSANHCFGTKATHQTIAIEEGSVAWRRIPCVVKESL